MLEVIKAWLDRLFADEEAVYLFLLLLAGLLLILTLGKILAPVLTALILAYLLRGLEQKLERWGVGSRLALTMVYTLFMGIVCALLFGVLPLIWTQLGDFINEQLPQVLDDSKAMLFKLQQAYPDLVTESQIQEWSAQLAVEVANVGQTVVSYSLSSIGSLMGVMIFVVLVPILVFFFLKDSDLMVRWFLTLLPQKRRRLSQIWGEMDRQIANYIRGKAFEIVVVGLACFIAFAALGLNYAALLAALVGLSVLIPYIGAVVVTVPVVLMGYIQFGAGTDLAWLVAVYLIIQGLDGNILVPVLFSEAVNLHPVAIIVAILVFGGMWGFWGVFFAIPLATLVKAVANAWPRGLEEEVVAE